MNLSRCRCWLSANHAVLEDELFGRRTRYVDVDFDLVVRVVNNDLVLRRGLPGSPMSPMTGPSAAVPSCL